jgi:asparagine synthase (glutamine-hydrolysing)
MVLNGYFSFDGLPAYDIRSNPKYKQFLFKTGWLQIDKNWIRKINYKSFLIFHKNDDSDSCKNISEFISSENSQYFGEVVSADFFSNHISNTENPISFAIYYDETSQTIRIARNGFGTIPLYYIHIPGKFLAFATDIPTLLAMKVSAPYLSISSKKINAYLSRHDHAVPYKSNTHFTNIHSILPGHVGTFNIDKVHQEMYLNYRKDSWKNLNTAGEFGEVFKEIFIKSVQREIPTQPKIGSHLSGGLDSSSVSAIIRYLRPDIELHTFYTDTLTELADESNYAQEVANKIGSVHHTIYSKYEDLDSIILSTSVNAQPFYGSIGASLLTNLFSKARELGCDAILTGHDGDSVVGHGAIHINELFIKKDWGKLREELIEIAKLDKFRVLFGREWDNYSISQRQNLIFQRNFDREIRRHLKEKSFNVVLSMVYSAYKHFGINPAYFLQSGFNRINEKLKDGADSSIPTYIQSNTLNVSGFETNSASQLFENYNEAYIDICYNQNIRVSEEHFNIGQHFNINLHHPFFDLTLYNFCQTIPAEILFNHGKGRGPLRTAMKGILPESVRNRTDKAAFNTYNRQQTLRLYNQSQDFLVKEATVWNYVNKAKFQTAATILNQDNHPLDTHTLMTYFVSRTIYLAVWLDNVGKAS